MPGYEPGRGARLWSQGVEVQQDRELGGTQTTTCTTKASLSNIIIIWVEHNHNGQTRKFLPTEIVACKQEDHRQYTG